MPRRVGSCSCSACQVLRYNQSQAYVVHYDYLESAEGHDFKSEGLGTNRFATVSIVGRVLTGTHILSWSPLEGIVLNIREGFVNCA